MDTSFSGGSGSPSENPIGQNSVHSMSSGQNTMPSMVPDQNIEQPPNVRPPEPPHLPEQPPMAPMLMSLAVPSLQYHATAEAAAQEQGPVMTAESMQMPSALATPHGFVNTTRLVWTLGRAAAQLVFGTGAGTMALAMKPRQDEAGNEQTMPPPPPPPQSSQQQSQQQQQQPQQQQQQQQQQQPQQQMPMPVPGPAVPPLSSAPMPMQLPIPMTMPPQVPPLLMPDSSADVSQDMDGSDAAGIDPSDIIRQVTPTDAHQMVRLCWARYGPNPTDAQRAEAIRRWWTENRSRTPLTEANLRRLRSRRFTKAHSNRRRNLRATLVDRARKMQQKQTGIMSPDGKSAEGKSDKTPDLSLSGHVNDIVNTFFGPMPEDALRIRSFVQDTLTRMMRVMESGEWGPERAIVEFDAAQNAVWMGCGSKRRPPAVRRGSQTRPRKRSRASDSHSQQSQPQPQPAVGVLPMMHAMNPMAPMMGMAPHGFGAAGAPSMGMPMQGGLPMHHHHQAGSREGSGSDAGATAPPPAMLSGMPMPLGVHPMQHGSMMPPMTVMPSMPPHNLVMQSMMQPHALQQQSSNSVEQSTPPPPPSPPSTEEPEPKQESTSD
ncbi:MAG: hypothetical protein MHM6MM_001563 [Cercozoa sp. M6MM]